MTPVFIVSPARACTWSCIFVRSSAAPAADARLVQTGNGFVGGDAAHQLLQKSKAVCACQCGMSGKDLQPCVGVAGVGVHHPGCQLENLPICPTSSAWEKSCTHISKGVSPTKMEHLTARSAICASA